MGGGNTTTQSSTSEPWSGAQPLLNQTMASAGDNLTAGVGQQVYQGSTVIPYADQTISGLDTIQSNANDNMNGAGMSGQYQNIINNGGLSQPQIGAMMNMQNAASGYQNDPSYQMMRQNTLDDAAHSVNEAMSASGRYGGAAHSDALVDQIAGAGAAMDMQQLSRMDAANQNVFNMGQQGFGNMGQAYSAMNQPAQDLMQVGSAYEDLATRVKNDELRIFDETQSKPWEILANANAIAGGAGSFGSSSTTAQGPSANPFLQAAGAGMSLSGLFGGF